MRPAWFARRRPRPRSTCSDGFFQNTGEAYARIDCKPVIGDLNELAEWDVFCRRSGWSGGAAIHIDTGMNRLGLTVTEAQGIIPRINAGDHGITLVMSHLASAELLNNPANARQLTAFREIASLFSGVPASLANSSGVFLGAQFQFDLVRPGCALYGINPTPEADNPMQPVVELKARIVQIRNVERGETVGYGGTWTARRPTRIAIVSAGYADGYFRAASANDGTRGAEVVVAGKRCPIAGRISMDLMAVDITDLEKNAVRRGHMVTLIGEGITVDELAHHFGTIGYEVLTSLGRRYARIYKGGDTAAEPPLRLRRSRRPSPPSCSSFLRFASCRGCALLRLPASQHFLAGVAELVLLLVQTCDDAAAAGRRAGAIFIIIRLAGAAPVAALSNRGSGASDGEHKNGEAQFRHGISRYQQAQ